MPLWKTTANTSDAGQPKFVANTDVNNIYANNAGYIHRRGGVYSDMHGNTRKKQEILVAINQLENTLGKPTVAQYQMSATTADVSGVANVILSFTEEVGIVGSPTITVQAGNTTGNTVPSTVTATYVSGNATNRLYFNFTADANAATYAVNSTINIANTQANQIYSLFNTTEIANLSINIVHTGTNSDIGTLTAS
tara:strand:- start:2388 stop:2972 length:585 start_codon:yes stop_codon:yes gene_type:complete